MGEIIDDTGMDDDFKTEDELVSDEDNTITFSTPNVEGMIMRRNKLDAAGTHPWKAEVTEGETGVIESVITGWFTQVYEPVHEEGGS